MPAPRAVTIEEFWIMAHTVRSLAGIFLNIFSDSRHGVPSGCGCDPPVSLVRTMGV
jgi:hypothetical protein